MRKEGEKEFGRWVWRVMREIKNGMRLVHLWIRWGKICEDRGRVKWRYCQRNLTIHVIDKLCEVSLFEVGL
jgi:hypothetical protein